jgi:hypothetical protein
MQLLLFSFPAAYTAFIEPILKLIIILLTGSERLATGRRPQKE